MIRMKFLAVSGHFSLRLRRNAVISISGPKSVVTIILNRNTFSVRFCILSPEMRYISTFGLLTFVESRSHVPLPKGIISTKFEADPTIRYRVMKLLLPIRYVTL